MLEKAHANISWVREMPNGDFRINFIFRDDLLPGLGIRDPVKPPVLKSAHAQLALAAVSLGVVLAGLALEQRRQRRDALALGAGCALAYLMQLQISTPIWRLVPELATIQFPWRFQTLMVLTTALLAGLALSVAWERAGGIEPARWRLVQVGAWVLAGLILANLALAGRNAHLKPFVYDEARNRSAGVVQWVEPAFTPVEFTLYRRFKELQVKMPRVFFREGRGDVSIAEWTSSSRKLELDSESGGRIGVRTFWFPGWRASIDGAPLEVMGVSPDGTLAFEVPAGRHNVKLRFESTPVRQAAAWVGLVALLALPILALGSARLRAKVHGHPEARSEQARSRRRGLPHRRGRGARDATSVDHRPGDGAPAHLERGRDGVGRLQRRDLQLPRAARRARGAGTSLQDRLRHRGPRAPLRRAGR
jgi:hypothetical protein